MRIVVGQMLAQSRTLSDCLLLPDFKAAFTMRAKDMVLEAIV